MAVDLGKVFEGQFKKTWLRLFPGTFFYRLKDDLNGFLDVSKNPCDFLCLPKDQLFMVECKETKKASVSLQAAPQYERLLAFKDCPNVRPGLLIWFSQHDIIAWFPIKEAEKIVLSGEKSFGIRHFDKYNITIIPTEKKRVYLEADYTVLINK